MVRYKMKVKNMVQGQERKGTYARAKTKKKEKMVNGLITGALALLLAIVSSAFRSSVVICIFSVLSLLLSGGAAVSKVVTAMKKSKFDDSVFVLLAVLISFFIGYFTVAAVAMALYRISAVIIEYFSVQADGYAKMSEEILPAFANLVDDTSNVQCVQSQSLTRGDTILIKTGETVPVDCVICDGFSEFDTSQVYQSEETTSFSSGDRILAGYINEGASITCEAVCDYDESLIMDMGRLASMSSTKSTRDEKRFATIAKWYPPIVLIIAALVLIIGGFSSGAWIPSMQRACVLFVVATTSSYLIAVPLISSAAVWNLKKKGLALASGDLLDEIADINCIAFEKNGILTDGVYQINEIYTAEGISEDDFLMIAANCIGGKTHPISKILTKYMNPYIPTENIMEFPGKGAECTIMEKAFLCGSEKFMKECNIDVSEVPGYTVYVSIDGVIMGAMKVQDNLKSNSSASMDKLRMLGAEKIVMMTSERKEIAEPVFADCGADELRAELSAYGRAEVISNLQKGEDVTCAYVGDIANGAQAIEEAHVGVSLIGKEDNGIEYAKAVLLGDLDTLADAIELCRLTCGKIELHFYCASAAKIVLGILGLFGAINIAAAVFVEAIVALTALYSASDLLKK